MADSPRRIGITRMYAMRIVVYASAPGASQLEAEAGALEALRRVTAQEGYPLEVLEQMTRDLLVLPETRAARRYPHAMRAWYELEMAEAEALEASEALR